MLPTLSYDEKVGVWFPLKKSGLGTFGAFVRTDAAPLSMGLAPTDFDLARVLDPNWRPSSDLPDAVGYTFWLHLGSLRTPLNWGWSIWKSIGPYLQIPLSTGLVSRAGQGAHTHTHAKIQQYLFYFQIFSNTWHSYQVADLLPYVRTPEACLVPPSLQLSI